MKTKAEAIADSCPLNIRHRIRQATPHGSREESCPSAFLSFYFIKTLYPVMCAFTIDD